MNTMSILLRFDKTKRVTLHRQKHTHTHSNLRLVVTNLMHHRLSISAYEFLFIIKFFSAHFYAHFFRFSFYRYNGFLPQGDKGRRRSKFVLHKRAEANGVRRSRHYIVQSPQTSKAILDANQHSISYTLSRNQAVIVEYKEDADTDMFQVNL